MNTKLSTQESQAPFRPLIAPDWVKDAVFYQIFPERFANGDTSNDPDHVEPWGAAPKGNNYFGGDLRGIIDHLDYISDLGANAIYLNPVFASTSNHKYFTSDYLKIDPAFGTNELFGQFVAECHKRNIRVVIDGVFNHTGVDHWAFQDIVKNERASKYFGWYNIYSFPVALPPKKPNYECWWNFGRLPKLMAEHPDVKAHLFEVTKYWTSKGIDGWRLDVPNEIPHPFWVEWRKLVKSLNPDCYIVGEIWTEADAWLKGDEFDAVMNYQFRDACLDFFCRGKLTPSEFDRKLSHTRTLYPDDVTYSLQNLVGSHDTERYLTLCKKEAWRVQLTALFQFTYIGAPMVYYGDEIGMEGGKDPDCRRTMVWDEHQWDRTLRDHFKKLISIRSQSPALRRGTFTMHSADDTRGTMLFERHFKDERLFVAINRNGQPADIDVPTGTQGGQYVDLMTKENVSLVNGRLQVAGHSGRVVSST